MRELLVELERRWQAMFSALAFGDDLPPAARLRTEGMMEAATLLGAATQEELDAALSRLYAGAFGYAPETEFGDDWRDAFPFPQIPAMARRAPVYPSTAD